jgi:hypothetical protein
MTAGSNDTIRAAREGEVHGLNRVGQRQRRLTQRASGDRRDGQRRRRRGRKDPDPARSEPGGADELKLVDELQLANEDTTEPDGEDGEHVDTFA